MKREKHVSKSIQHRHPFNLTSSLNTSNNPLRTADYHEEICVTNLSSHCKIRTFVSLYCPRIRTTNMQTSYCFFFFKICARKSISSPSNEVEVFVAFTVSRAAMTMVPCVVTVWPRWSWRQWEK